MRASSRGIKGRRRAFHVGKALIVGEVAMSLVLFAGAGSFARSLTNLTNQSFGFDSDRVLVVDIDPGLARYDYRRLAPLYEQLRTRLSALPGVTSASLSRYSPFNLCCWAFSIQVSGYAPQPDESTSVLPNRISPRYFETIGTRMLRGRSFDERDAPGAPRVAVVNAAFAQRYFSTSEPIGGRFGIERRLSVVGMVITEALLQGVSGVALGVPIAMAVTGIVSHQLYGVDPADPVNLAAAVFVLLLAVTLAAYLPARRASTTDPIRVLRHE